MIREQLRAEIEPYVSGAPTLGMPVAWLTAASVTGADQKKHTAAMHAVARVARGQRRAGVRRGRRSMTAATASSRDAM